MPCAPRMSRVAPRPGHLWDGEGAWSAGKPMLMPMP